MQSAGSDLKDAAQSLTKALGAMGTFTLPGDEALMVVPKDLRSSIKVSPFISEHGYVCTYALNFALSFWSVYTL